MGRANCQGTMVSPEAGMPAAFTGKRTRRAPGASKAQVPPRFHTPVPTPPAEGDLLLRELVHRIKNSLTIISSIANLEAQTITDPAAQEIILRLKSRIAATALLYDRLSSGAESGTVRLDIYLKDLATLLVESLAAEPSLIELELDLELLPVSPRMAGALGLIVNEAITNSFKYGLVARGGGRLRLGCRRLGRGRCRLLVSDDGPGFPQSILDGKARDFGFTLMGLEAEELGGRLDLEPGPGAAISVTFPLPPKTARN